MCITLYYVISLCVWTFYLSVLFSNVNFLQYMVSTVEYKYAVLVE